MSGGRKGSKTAAELMAELEQQPEFVRRRQEMARRERENRRRYDEAAEGLLRDLERAGFSVATMAELRQPGIGDARAVPVLVEWLPRIEYRPLKRDVIATLGSPWAAPEAVGPLVEDFRRIDPTHDEAPGSIRWAIGDALERVADESVLDALVEIATDTRHGDQRGLVVAALGNMGEPRGRVVPVLLGLLRDEEVAGYAIMGLAKLRALEATPAIVPFLEHSEGWVRDEAHKALTKLEA